MSHKHCVFCGEELPVPRPVSFVDICMSPANTTNPDTVGNRHHAYFIGRSANHPKPVAVACGCNHAPCEHTGAKSEAPAEATKGCDYCKKLPCQCERVSDSPTTQDETVYTKDWWYENGPRIADELERLKSEIQLITAPVESGGGYVAQLSAERDALKTERDKLQQLIDLQHTRTIRADKAWQKRHGKPNVIPDLGELIDWMMQELAIAGENAEEAEAEAESAEQQLEAMRTALQDIGLAVGIALGEKVPGTAPVSAKEWREIAEKVLRIKRAALGEKR